MVITLYRQELLGDLRKKSHEEVSNIVDVEARYRAEAGTEKMDDILRCVEEGVGRRRRRCWRYLRPEYTESTDDVVVSPDEYRIELVLSERRALGKAEPLAKVMHSFVVDYALSKFYSDVAQQELSNKHSLLAEDDGREIDELLYTKVPPRI